MVAILNDTMVPRIELSQIVRSHRIGPKVDKQGRLRTRQVIVRFGSERDRDIVYRSRFGLKTFNATNKNCPLFINEDLTAIRASLAYDSRMLKKQKKIQTVGQQMGRYSLRTELIRYV